MASISRRLLGQYILDGALVYVALTCAWLLRFDFATIRDRWDPVVPYLVFLPIPYLLSFHFFRLYRLHWRYFGLQDTVTLALAVLVAATVTLMGGLLFGVPPLPNRVTIIQGLVMFILAGGFRVALRVLDLPLWSAIRNAGKPKQRLLIVGAGDVGERLVRAVLANPSYQAVGFVDDAISKRGQRIHGVDVLGTTHDIPRLVRDLEVHIVVIAIPSAQGEAIRRIFGIARETSARILVVPAVQQILSGEVPVTRFREVSIDDLLRRPPVEIDLEQVARLVHDERVLVTGAGGSIGSELCRQIANLGPQSLILLGHGENSIFEIQKELETRYPDLPLQAWICDVKDRKRLERCFSQARPTLVFHAAAHKHVPLMEMNIAEAVRNNVLGTRNVAELAVRYGVHRMVLISTDKAVNPTSVMGATKRVCELIVRMQAARTEATGFAIVRFGNVLGSRGSVIPTMKRQIEAGGPVTVTHPDMKRYFMTIPEAVSLVLQAATLGDRAEVFVLDMGEPVRILDLAQDLIRLSGYVPGQDIPIEITGIRPGEKLEEQLFTDFEVSAKTSHPKITVARQAAVGEADSRGVDALLQAAEEGDDELIRSLLMRLAGGDPLSRLAETDNGHAVVMDPCSDHQSNADPR